MQRIILSEDKRGIEFLQTTAQTNLQTLRRINELAPELNSEEKILATSAKPRAIILQKFFERFPEAERQSQYSKIEFAIPPDLEELGGRDERQADSHAVAADPAFGQGPEAPLRHHGADVPVVVGELGQLAVALAPGGAGPHHPLQSSGLARAQVEFYAGPLRVRPALS